MCVTECVCVCVRACVCVRVCVCTPGGRGHVDRRLGVVAAVVKASEELCADLQRPGASQTLHRSYLRGERNHRVYKCRKLCVCVNVHFGSYFRFSLNVQTTMLKSFLATF